MGSKSNQKLDRRLFIKTIGVAAAVSPFGIPKILRGQDCDITTADIMGPFFDEDAPFRILLAHPDEPGDRLFIEGTVFTDDCETPIHMAMVEVWQANDDGCYSVFQQCNTGNPENDEFNLRGKMFTNSTGKYAFETIKPADYGSRPSHIHFKATTPDGQTLVTQLYFEGNPLNDTDPWASQAGVRIIPLTEEADGFHGTFDIIMNTTVEGIQKGDVNLDGIIDVADIILIIDIILGNMLADDFQLYAADINYDGYIDVIDVVATINIILGNSVGMNRDTISNSEIFYGDGKVKLRCDGDIAGLQLGVSGDFSLIKKNLPDGWEMYANNETILIFNLGGEKMKPNLLFEYKGDLKIESNVITNWQLTRGAADIIYLSDDFVLGNPYPNPFNATVQIPYEILNPGNVNISVFDIRGRKVETLVKKHQSSGGKIIKWNASDQASGIYLVKMDFEGNQTFIRKIILSK